MRILLSSLEHINPSRLSAVFSPDTEFFAIRQGNPDASEEVTHTQLAWCTEEEIEGGPESLHIVVPVNSSFDIVVEMTKFIKWSEITLSNARSILNIHPHAKPEPSTVYKSVVGQATFHFYYSCSRESPQLYRALAASITEASPASSRSAKATKSRHWSENLLPYLEDLEHPEVLKRTEDMVIFADKYPKGRWHFLCLPQKRIDNWTLLKKCDIPLLKKMLNLSKEFARELLAKETPDSDLSLLLADTFMFGFHAIPSMKQLHLHIISKDFSAPTMRTKAHWHAFTTDFFVPVSIVLTELEERGFIAWDASRKDYYTSLLEQPLACPLCEKSFGSLPVLRDHYASEYRSSRSVRSKSLAD